MKPLEGGYKRDFFTIRKVNGGGLFIYQIAIWRVLFQYSHKKSLVNGPKGKNVCIRDRYNTNV